MQDYDIAVAPGAPRQIDAVGNYLYFYAGNAGGADATLRVRGLSSGLSVQLAPGQAFRLPPGKTEESWILSNKAGAASILGTVVIGNGEITDNTVQGFVSVVDGGKSRTLGGGAFGGTSYQGAVASQYPSVGLWNANTAKNLIVSQIIAYSLTGAWVAAVRHLSSNAGWSVLGGGQANAASKKVGGAASAAQNIALSQVGSLTGAQIGGLSGVAGQSAIYKVTEPIVVPPGAGLAVGVGNVTGGDCGATFEFYEESV